MLKILRKIIEDFKNIGIFKDLDKKIFNFMKKGFVLSYFMGIVAILLLVIYKNSYISYDLVEASMILFRAGMLFLVAFFICGITVNKLCKMH